MSIKFFGILTHQGAARLANAAALGTKLDLSTMAVGDGGGSLPFPEPTQTALKGERRRAALNQLSIDPLNGNQIIAEQVIPENEGGWWIREIGLFDKDGTLIAVSNCPESYKPQMQEGSGRTQTIRMILIVNSTEELALKIDPSIVLATRQYVDDGVIEVKAYADTLMETHTHHSDPHPQYAPKASPVFTGTPTAPTAKANDNSTQLATTAFVQTAQNACLRKDDNLAALKDKAKSRANLEVYSRSEADNHYLPKTGGTVNGPLTVEGPVNATVPDYLVKSGIIHDKANNVRNTQGLRLQGEGAQGSDIFFWEQIGKSAAMKFHVWSGGQDGVFDFHNTGEFRASGGATFGSNITVSWGGRTATFQENGDVVGPIWGGALSTWLNNQLRQGVPPGIPLPWPQQEAPAGWLKCNGAPFDKALFPLLAQAYPSGALPDLRGEFIRGWDDGRSVDAGRGVLSWQEGQSPVSGPHGYWGNDNWNNGKQRDTGFQFATGTDNGGWHPIIQQYEHQRETRPRNVAFNYIVRAA